MSTGYPWQRVLTPYPTRLVLLSPLLLLSLHALSCSDGLLLALTVAVLAAPTVLLSRLQPSYTTPAAPFFFIPSYLFYLCVSVWKIKWILVTTLFWVPYNSIVLRPKTILAGIFKKNNTWVAFLWEFFHPSYIFCFFLFNFRFSAILRVINLRLCQFYICEFSSALDPCPLEKFFYQK